MPSVRKDKGGGMTKETRALIEAAEQAYEALRLSYNVTDYPANGDTIQDHAMTALKAAISSAKAAEEITRCKGCGWPISDSFEVREKEGLCTMKPTKN